MPSPAVRLALAPDLQPQDTPPAQPLIRRVAFVIAALLIYRLGKHIPVPGIDYPGLMESLYGGGMRMTGAIERMSAFALGIWPYVSATLVMLFLIWLAPPLARMTKSRSGRVRLHQYTLALTVLIAGFQAAAVAVGLERVALHGDSLVQNPGLTSRIAIVAALVGGSLFLVWLAERITVRGFGDGVLILLFADIAAGLPDFGRGFMEYVRLNVHQPKAPYVIGALMLASVAGVVFIELARRRIPLAPSAGNPGGIPSDLPLRLNPSGLAPLFMGAGFLVMAIQLAYEWDPIWFNAEGRFIIGAGSPGHLGFLAALIVLFAMSFRTLYSNDPEEIAARMGKSGATISGLAVGETAAAHIAQVQTRIAALGALYLAALGLLPELLVRFADVPFTFGGWHLLVLVMVPLVWCLAIADQFRG